jgi:hypothetical protein
MENISILYIGLGEKIRFLLKPAQPASLSFISPWPIWRPSAPNQSEAFILTVQRREPELLPSHLPATRITLTLWPTHNHVARTLSTQKQSDSSRSLPRRAMSQSLSHIRKSPFGNPNKFHQYKAKTQDRVSLDSKHPTTDLFPCK